MSDEDKLKNLKEVMTVINNTTMDTVARSIATIKTPTAMVNEYEYISDYLRNCDSKTFNQIRDHVIKQREVSEIKPLNISCGSCKHEYKQSFTLDLASFFDNNSWNPILRISVS